MRRPQPDDEATPRPGSGGRRPARSPPPEPTSWRPAGRRRARREPRLPPVVVRAPLSTPDPAPGCAVRPGLVGGQELLDRTLPRESESRSGSRPEPRSATGERTADGDPAPARCPSRAQELPSRERIQAGDGSSSPTAPALRQRQRERDLRRAPREPPARRRARCRAAQPHARQPHPTRSQRAHATAVTTRSRYSGVPADEPDLRARDSRAGAPTRGRAPLGREHPTASCSRVVLPAPFGPTSAATAPPGRESEQSRSAHAAVPLADPDRLERHVTLTPSTAHARSAVSKIATMSSSIQAGLARRAIGAAAAEDAWPRARDGSDRMRTPEAGRPQPTLARARVRLQHRVRVDGKTAPRRRS